MKVQKEIDDYIVKLEKYIDTANETGDEYAFIDPAYDIMDSIEMLEMPFEAVEPIFLLIERSPNIDFGGPGPLGSFLEGFYRNGYEEALLKSLQRDPTEYTVYLLSRLCNDKNNKDRPKYIQLIKTYENNDCLSDDWKEIVKNISE